MYTAIHYNYDCDDSTISLTVWAPKLQKCTNPVKKKHSPNFGYVLERFSQSYEQMVIQVIGQMFVKHQHKNIIYRSFLLVGYGC